MKYPIRKIFKHEIALYEQHLLALDANSKHMRFAYPIKDESISEFIKTVEKDFDNHCIFVAESLNCEVIAVGHVSIVGDKTELAFSVLPAYQGQGVGSAMMDRCVTWCQNRGITNVYMVCLSSNAAVRKLATKHGLKMQSEYGETVADATLPNLTPFTILNEVTESSIANFAYLQRTALKLSDLTLYNLTLIKQHAII